MGENNKNENVYVTRLDNTQVRRPLLQLKFLKATPTLLILSYIKTFGIPELPLLTKAPNPKEQEIARERYLNKKVWESYNNSAKQKKLTARDYVGFVPGIGDIIDFGLTGYEVATDLAHPIMLGLSAIGFIPWVGDALKKGKKAVGEIAEGLDAKKVEEYIERKDMYATHPTYKNIDHNFIEDNVLREIAWLPNAKIALTSNTFTTLLNAVRRMNEPLYTKALSDYLIQLRKSGNIKLLDLINEGIKRIERARTVVKDDATKTFLGYFAIPKEWAESDKYSFLKENVAGVTFGRDGKGYAFVRKPVEMIKNRSTTPLHEVEHVYQLMMSPTGLWHNALTELQLALYNKVYRILPTHKIKASADIVEKSTTNKELLRLISDLYYKKTGRMPNYWELNEFITNLPEEDLLNIFKKPVNGYHQDYLDYYNTEGYKDPEFMKNFRNILKFGPMLATPFLINNNLQ